MDLDLSVSGGGQTFTAGALTTGDEAFISYQGTDYRVPENQFQRYKRKIERDARRDKNRNNNFSFAQLGINPRDWIENPKNEGTRTSVARRRSTSRPMSTSRRSSRTSTTCSAAPRASACRTSSSRAS